MEVEVAAEKPKVKEKFAVEKLRAKEKNAAAARSKVGFVQAALVEVEKALQEARDQQLHEEFAAEKLMKVEFAAMELKNKEFPALKLKDKEEVSPARAHAPWPRSASRT